MTLLISVDILSGDKVLYSAVQYCAELPRSHPLCSEGLQYSIVQYSTVQSFRGPAFCAGRGCVAVQYSTVQYSAELPRSRPLCWQGTCCSTVQYTTVQYSTVLPRARPLCWEGMCCQARVRKLGRCHMMAALSHA